MKAAKRKNETEIARLRLAPNKKARPSGCVFFDSSWAQYMALREFRTDVLHNDAMQGTFVSTRFYTEFVKGSLRMKCDTGSKQLTASAGWPDIAEQEWSDAVFDIATHGQDLLSSYRTNFPYYCDCAALQSHILARLIERALCRLAGEASHDIHVTHHCEVAVNADGLTVCASMGNERIKVPFYVNVAIWVEDSEKGRIDLAVCEFDADNKDPAGRQTRVDMNVATILTKSKLPCIAVDVAGNQDFNKWSFRASAPVVNHSYDVTNATYIKSFILASINNKGGCVEGAEGIVRLAAGLLRARHFVKTPTSLLLGPVVAVHSEDDNSRCRVVKAYHDSPYGNHNIALVRQLVDEHATLWTSKDMSLHLVEMHYFPSDWTESIKAVAFTKILRHLQVLHDQGLVHGDVRLGNMLTRSVLIDLDYVGETKYPYGYRNVCDGRRHPEVRESIGDGNEDDLLIDVKHDLFSMGAVMEFFRPVALKHTELWQGACAALLEANESSLSCALSLVHELATGGAALSLTERDRIRIFGSLCTVVYIHFKKQ
jgi:hypothetical protein